MTVTIEDVRAAAAVLNGHIALTPTKHSKTLSQIYGATLFLKVESLQFTASFKERGALNRLDKLDAGARKAGVIAMSAGNHAQAVAYHAQRLGIAATIVMPRHTPFLKVTNTEALGATVVLEGEDLDQAAAYAVAEAEAHGLAFIHPFDDEAVIAGQGTVALEMLEAVPDLEMLVVPVGGGGLIAGCITAAKALKPEIEILGVQSALCPAMLSAISGIERPNHDFTLAEGIAVKRPGRLTRAIIEDNGVELVTVGEGEIEQAVMVMAEIEKLVVEGAGAAALAAVIAARDHDPDRFAGRRVGIVVSGGNIDARLLAGVLMRGLVRLGRLVRLRVEISDQPGSLARISQRIGALGSNIVEVIHHRWFHDVPARLTGVEIMVEVRAPEEAGRLVEALAGDGFRVERLALSAGHTRGREA